MAEQQTVVGTLNAIQATVAAVNNAYDFQKEAAGGPYEEVLVRHSIGTGTVRIQTTGPDEDKGQYIIVTGTMYTLQGIEDGKYEAVFKAGYDNPTFADLTNYPPKPNNIYDRPTHLEQIPHLARTKARWTFADGSSCEGPGPAPSFIAPLVNGGAQFWVSAGAVVVAGTDKYDGVIGQETSLGSTYFPTPPNLVDGTQFEAKVIHVFKLIRKENRAPATS